MSLRLRKRAEKMLWIAVTNTATRRTLLGAPTRRCRSRVARLLKTTSSRLCPDPKTHARATVAGKHLRNQYSNFRSVVQCRS